MRKRERRSRRGRLADAEAAYEDVIAASPESAFLYLELAEIKQQQGELDEALAHTRRARRLEPNEPDAVLMEGLLLESLGDLEAAEASYELAEALNPTPESEEGLLRVRPRATARGTAGRVPRHPR